MDAAGEFFDELAANCLDTTVSDKGKGFPPSEKCLKTKRSMEKRKGGKSGGLGSIL